MDSTREPGLGPRGQQRYRKGPESPQHWQAPSGLSQCHPRWPRIRVAARRFASASRNTLASCVQGWHGRRPVRALPCPYPIKTSGHFPPCPVYPRRGRHRHVRQGIPLRAGEACRNPKAAWVRGGSFSHRAGGVSLPPVSIPGPSGKTPGLLLPQSASGSGRGGRFPAPATAARDCLSLAAQAACGPCCGAQGRSGAGRGDPGAASGFGGSGR